MNASDRRATWVGLVFQLNVTIQLLRSLSAASVTSFSGCRLSCWFDFRGILSLFLISLIAILLLLTPVLRILLHHPLSYRMAAAWTCLRIQADPPQTGWAHHSFLLRSKGMAAYAFTSVRAGRPKTDQARNQISHF